MTQDVNLPELEALRADFLRELAEAAGREDELARIRSAYFGPKGRMTSVLRGLGQIPPEQRPEAGRRANEVRQALTGQLDAAQAAVAEAKRHAELHASRVDLTLPGRRPHPRGTIHPINRVIAELEAVFTRLGFDVATGPEVELDWYNFEALNFPTDHPARDMQDTFFVKTAAGVSDRSLLLRTHTSPVQIRAMKARGVPLRIIAPGRVYRCDSDATHSPMFHQIEGLWVDEGVSFAHLKGVLTEFLGAFFGKREVRFRPSFFPFVEPGAEVDMRCVFCEGAGCRLCKGTGWMEILGAGMVHPNVLEAAGVDSERYSGFAFGLGIDRIAMLRYGVDDLAHLFKSDVRFLEQL
jgi:phenylalanyl-tRNA synthetase alpha chain